MSRRCQGCGGLLGRDCFNESECIWITNEMNRQEDPRIREYEIAQQKEYEDGQPAYYRDMWCRENSLAYRLLINIKSWIDNKLLLITSKAPF